MNQSRWRTKHKYPILSLVFLFAYAGRMEASTLNWDASHNQLKLPLGNLYIQHVITHAERETLDAGTTRTRLGRTRVDVSQVTTRRPSRNFPGVAPPAPQIQMVWLDKEDIMFTVPTAICVFLMWGAHRQQPCVLMTMLKKRHSRTRATRAAQATQRQEIHLQVCTHTRSKA